jgi:hypothetical protein
MVTFSHRAGWPERIGLSLAAWEAGERTRGTVKDSWIALVLQRLYDSEINVTITMLWDDGFDFAGRLTSSQSIYEIN